MLSIKQKLSAIFKQWHDKKKLFAQIHARALPTKSTLNPCWCLAPRTGWLANKYPVSATHQLCTMIFCTARRAQSRTLGSSESIFSMTRCLPPRLSSTLQTPDSRGQYDHRSQRLTAPWFSQVSAEVAKYYRHRDE